MRPSISNSGSAHTAIPIMMLALLATTKIAPPNINLNVNNTIVFKMIAEYKISVYKDYAIVEGGLPHGVIELICQLCKIEGFTHITHYEGEGFKLIREIPK
jgi:hypothetical protein